MTSSQRATVSVKWVVLHNQGVAVKNISHFRNKMIDGMIERGYDEAFAIRCFRQIEGFGMYGFPESHAASFALLVYVSAWLKCHYPDVFICALLNAQPMGFYAPAQLIAEAKQNNITIRPVDVNFSGWDHRLESDLDNRKGHHALRLGLRLVKGLARGEGERIAASQTTNGGKQTGLSFSSLDDVMRKADVSAKSLQAIADADGFASLAIDRRQALWAARGLARHRLHLQLAKVTTLGERVEDTFLLSGPELQGQRAQLAIETELKMTKCLKVISGLASMAAG